MGLLKYLHKDRVVYMSEPSQVIYDALVLTHQEAASEAEIRTLPFDKKVKISEAFTLMLSQVDHGVPGSSGVLIQTPSQTIAYTGDYKFHGRNPKWTEETIEKWSKEEVDVLITETTTLKTNSDLLKPYIITEQMLDEQAADLIEDQEGHLYVNYLIRDIERVHALLKLCQAKNKKLAMSKVNGTIWAYCSERLGYDLFEEHIVLYDAEAEG